jgi:hypothetical protein
MDDETDNNDQLLAETIEDNPLPHMKEFRDAAIAAGHSSKGWAQDEINPADYKEIIMPGPPSIVYERAMKGSIFGDPDMDNANTSISNSTNNENEETVRKNVCGDVVNPDTGLPEINWDRHYG